MRKYTTYIIIVLTAIILSACNNKSNNVPSKQDPLKEEAYMNSDSAVLYYTDNHFNLDTITVGKAASCVFNYTNKGKAPLLISNVFTSCGCVEITWAKEPLMPEQSNSIKLNITIQGPGYFQKAIVVKNNSINEPVMTIRLEGFAVE